MGKRNRTSMLLLGTIIGIFIATIFLGISDIFHIDWIEFISAIGTVGAVMVSLWATNDSKKVKFDPKVELELGNPKSSAINSIKYRIYGFNSGDTGDAIKTIRFSFKNKGRYVELFSKEQIINIEAGKFMDFSCKEEITPVSEFFKTNTTEKLTGYVIGKYNSASYELITYSGRIYKRYIDVVVQSEPKWRVIDAPNYEGDFQILSINGSTVLSNESLKDDSAKSKFSVNSQSLESNDKKIYTIFHDQETAFEVLEQYKKEQIDRY